MALSSAVARAIAAVVATGAAAGVWGTLIERRLYMLRRANLAVLPPGAKPLTVLHISDIHMAPWQSGKQDWIRRLAELEPDLIVDTGDNLGHERGLEGIRRAFEPFACIPGVFVHGSNDYWKPVPHNPFRYFGGPSTMRHTPQRIDTNHLTTFLADDLGWIDLNNRAASLDIKGTRLELLGVNDPHRHYDKLDALTGSIEAERENSPYYDEAPWPREPTGTDHAITVGVAHAPYQRVLNSFVTHGARLMLAGHTHGGQVRIPGFGALVTNCDIPRAQARGVSMWTHAHRAAYLQVSAGLGTSIYAPVRFACPPEVTLLTLTEVD
jgi:predicted MPP superfamily phosphohydrolase